MVAPTPMYGAAQPRGALQGGHVDERVPLVSGPFVVDRQALAVPGHPHDVGAPRARLVERLEGEELVRVAIAVDGEAHLQREHADDEPLHQPPPPPRLGARRAGRLHRAIVADRSVEPTAASWPPDGDRLALLLDRLGRLGLARCSRGCRRRCPRRRCVGRIRSSQRGSHQLRSPSSSIVAGTSSMRTMVASSSTAHGEADAEQLDRRGRPRAGSCRRRTTMIAAAAVMTRAVVARPSATALALSPVRSYSSLMRREQEDLVVHRQPEDDGEQHHRHERLDRAALADADEVLHPAPLEDRDDDAVGGADRQQVHDDGLERHEQRAEHGHQEQERQSEHGAEEERQRGRRGSRRSRRARRRCPVTATSSPVPSMAAGSTSSRRRVDQVGRSPRPAARSSGSPATIAAVGLSGSSRVGGVAMATPSVSAATASVTDRARPGRFRPGSP